MKYLRFKKDNPRYGYKAEQVIAVRSKIPKDLENYVTETTQGVYDKYQAEQLELQQQAEDELIAISVKEERAEAEAQVQAEVKKAKKV